jgi:hypothetical protein
LAVKPAYRTSLFDVRPDPCEEPYAVPDNVEERPPLLILGSPNFSLKIDFSRF